MGDEKAMAIEEAQAVIRASIGRARGLVGESQRVLQDLCTEMADAAPDAVQTTVSRSLS